ncbi:MAG: FadR/GntR family transcriptional regulator [Thermomicrobiales bacterium]
MTGLTSLTSNGFVSRDTLAAHLERRIMAGELTAGEKLPSERQLSERYGVSRPVVREALRSLVERQLVEVQPGRGAFVRRARLSDAAGRLEAVFRRTQATARDVVEARTMLECTAASLAAQRATPADLAALETALDQFDRATDIIEQARCDLTFHLGIVRAARNPVVETMFGSITGLAVELMLRSLGDWDVASVSLPYHRQIADAIRARDPRQARSLMEAHLAVAATLYGEDYERSIESIARREVQRLFPPGVTLDDLLAETIGQERRATSER